MDFFRKCKEFSAIFKKTATAGGEKSFSPSTLLLLFHALPKPYILRTFSVCSPYLWIRRIYGEHTEKAGSRQGGDRRGTGVVDSE